MAKWLTRWSAKPVFMGSNPIRCSIRSIAQGSIWKCGAGYCSGKCSECGAFLCHLPVSPLLNGVRGLGRYALRMGNRRLTDIPLHLVPWLRMRLMSRMGIAPRKLSKSMLKLSFSGLLFHAFQDAGQLQHTGLDLPLIDRRKADLQALGDRYSAAKATKWHNINIFSRRPSRNLFSRDIAIK